MLEAERSAAEIVIVLIADGIAVPDPASRSASSSGCSPYLVSQYQELSDPNQEFLRVAKEAEWPGDLFVRQASIVAFSVAVRARTEESLP